MIKIFLISFLLTFIHLNALSQDTTGNIPESASLLSDYIRIASVTGSEKEAGLYFSKLCERKGFYVKEFPSGPGSYNFAASLYPLETAKPNIILLNHIDVVAADKTTGIWQYPPYSGTIADSTVWGRGALDNKGMAIMQLLAVSGFVKLAASQNLPYNVTILSVSSEETGGERGAMVITAGYMKQLNAAVVFGEGGCGVSGILDSDPGRKVFGIAIAQKQGLQLRLHLRTASSGHGSVPPDEYANKGMVQALARLLERGPDIMITKPAALMFRALGEHERGLRGYAMRHPWLLKTFGGKYLRQDPIIRSLVTNTITVTSLSNPQKAINQIPQSITATLDCRLLPGTSQAKFIRQLKAVLGEEEVEIEVISSFKAAAYSEPASPFFDKLSKAVKRVYPEALVIPILFPASNDNNNFRAQGVPSFGLLPIYLDKELLASIHNIDERMPISALESGIEVYSLFLKSILTQETGQYKE